MATVLLTVFTIVILTGATALVASLYSYMAGVTHDARGFLGLGLACWGWAAFIYFAAL